MLLRGRAQQALRDARLSRMFGSFPATCHAHHHLISPFVVFPDFVQVEATIGLDCTEAIHASAKAGIGIKDILEVRQQHACIQAVKSEKGARRGACFRRQRCAFVVYVCIVLVDIGLSAGVVAAGHGRRVDPLPLPTHPLRLLTGDGGVNGRWSGGFFPGTCCRMSTPLRPMCAEVPRPSLGQRLLMQPFRGVGFSLFCRSNSPKHAGPPSSGAFSWRF